MGGKERPELLYGGKSESGDGSIVTTTSVPLGFGDPILIRS
jgi:hypothetical protein